MFRPPEPLIAFKLHAMALCVDASGKSQRGAPPFATAAVLLIYNPQVDGASRRIKSQVNGCVLKARFRLFS